MGLITTLTGLPLAPVRGVIALGRLIQERVDHERSSPASIRRALEQAEEARADEKISADEEAEIQRKVIGRAVGPDVAEPREE